jgi:very-short-patch-repair endonuclease
VSQRSRSSTSATAVAGALARASSPFSPPSSAEVDALWPDARLIVELDSWEFHAHRAAFEKDRSRDTDHLLAGYRTIRVTHRQLSDGPDRLAAQIRALLA